MQCDLILTYALIISAKTLLQIRLYSEVLGVHEFGGRGILFSSVQDPYLIERHFRARSIYYPISIKSLV